MQGCCADKTIVILVTARSTNDSNMSYMGLNMVAGAVKVSRVYTGNVVLEHVVNPVDVVPSRNEGCRRINHVQNS
jgi:hypothetical protein